MNNQNFKYIKNYKSFDNGFGKTMDTRTPKQFKLGDKVEVFSGVEKYAGQQGVIIVPIDLHKVKEASTEMVKVKFDDGKSDYLSVNDIFKI